MNKLSSQTDEAEAFDTTMAEGPFGAPLYDFQSPIAFQRFNLNRLRYFVTVAQELHFGRAAQRLGISQPPLSQSIKALETELGRPLFQRTSRTVALTEVGRILLARAIPILERTQELNWVIDIAREGQRGKINIGVVSAATYDLLPRILRSYRAQYANVKVELREGSTPEIVNWVREGKIEVGLVLGGPSDGSLKVQPLLSRRFNALVPRDHPLAAANEITLESLVHEPLILPPRAYAPVHYDSIIRAFASRNLSPHLGYEVPTVLSQIGYVESGLGVALVIGCLRRLLPCGVVAVPVEASVPPAVFAMTWSEAIRSPVRCLFRQVAGEVMLLNV